MITCLRLLRILFGSNISDGAISYQVELNAKMLRHRFYQASISTKINCHATYSKGKLKYSQRPTRQQTPLNKMEDASTFSYFFLKRSSPVTPSSKLNRSCAARRASISCGNDASRKEVRKFRRENEIGMQRSLVCIDNRDLHRLQTTQQWR